MDLVYTQQVNPQDFADTEFDLVVSTLGQGDRANYLISNYKLNGKEKIALVYSKKHRNIFIQKNSKIFRDQNFNFLDTDINSSDLLLQKIQEILKEFKGNKFRLLMDISLMKRNFYMDLINYLSEIENVPFTVEVHFSYTPTEFKAKNSLDSPKVYLANQQGEQSASGSDMPKALIIGLGSGTDGLKEIIDQFKPDLISAFYPDPAPEGYVEAVLERNRDIVSEIEMRYLVNYPLSNTEETMVKLTSLILNLRLKYRIFILSIGPKLFTLQTMLMAVQYPDIYILKAERGFREKSLKRKPVPPPLIIRCEFNCFDD